MKTSDIVLIKAMGERLIDDAKKRIGDTHPVLCKRLKQAIDDLMVEIDLPVPPQMLLAVLHFYCSDCVGIDPDCCRRAAHECCRCGCHVPVVQQE